MSYESKPINVKDFQLAIDDLSDDVLLSLKSQLLNSLDRLKNTNDELSEEIKTIEYQLKVKTDKNSTETDEDIKLYKTTIEENIISIKNQKERLDILTNELVRRGLESSTNSKDGVYL